MRSCSLGEGLLIFVRKTRLGQKRRAGWKIPACVAILVAAAFLAITAVERAIIPTLIAIAESEVTRVANTALVDAVNKHIADIISGKNLLEFCTGPNGELLYVKTNPAELNRIQSEALSVLQDAFSKLQGFSVDVPLGQTLGSKIFAPLGPKIRIRLFPVGSVQVQTRDSFDVTGINQTKYNIYLQVSCRVRVVIPLIATQTQVNTDIPLATVLIPGKVPNTYLSLPGAH